MAYIQIDDFKLGQDRRRERVAGAPGTMWDAKNVHVTRGGDIERRKKFVAQYHVPNTFYAISLRGQLYVLGSQDNAASMPIGVLYQRLLAPANPLMTRILDAKTFSGKIYAIAEFDNGHVYHFYDGSRVTDWDVLAASNGSFEALATLMAGKVDSDPAVSATSFGSTITIQALVPGTAFTIVKSTLNGGGVPDQDITLTQVQANVAAVTEVRASAAIQITGGTAAAGNQISSVNINGVGVTSGALLWASTNSATAIRLAQDITNGYNTHGYSASAIGDTVTVQAAPGTGGTPNGFLLDVIVAGNVTVVAGGSLAGGISAVSAVAQVYTASFIGTFETLDQFFITINGTQYAASGRASGTGRSLYVDKNRVWSPTGSLENYCKLNDATVWDPAAGGSDAGFLNIASQTEGNEQIVVVARYQNLAAIFSGTDVVMYALDQDPTKNAFQNVLENTGTRAAAAVIRYGNNDVFYLDYTGIRSLRARDASNAPFVSDVGNAIDTFVQSFLDGLTTLQVSSAIGAIEPRDGRLWVIAGSRIFVLSYFPDAQISAWSYYDAEEFGGNGVQAVCKIKSRLFVRAGDYVYCYGGLDGTVYPNDDEIVAEVQMPFLSGSTPATIKNLAGFDIAGTNVWHCEVAYDPNAPDKTATAGTFREITYAEAGENSLPGRTSMVAPVFTCSKAGPATISMAAIHYEAEKAD